jgi:DNA-binding MarR family transcriptional regulator
MRRDPAVLSEPGDRLALETFLPYRIMRASEMVSRRFAALYKERHGLTRPEWRTFATVGEFGSVTATAIGAHSSMHKTKVSRAIRSLEDRGWLTRRADECDRRIEHIELTREGARRYRDLVVLAREFEAELRDLLGSKGLSDLDGGLTAIETQLSGW